MTVVWVVVVGIVVVVVVPPGLQRAFRVAIRTITEAPTHVTRE